MTMILDVKFDEFTKEYAERDRGYSYRSVLEDMADAARDFAWAGLGLVDDGTGEPLEYWTDGWYYNCDCRENFIRVNSESTLAAFMDAGVETYEWRGWIVWDASNPAGYEIARSVSSSLADYPCLDDERLSSLEWDNACAMIDDWYTLPEGVEAADVVREMPEVPFCSNCSSCDVEEGLASLGYSQCMDCSSWIKTGEYPSDRVCYSCAEREQEGSCECIPSYVDGLRHMSLYPTASDLREIQRGCETCYPVRWPHGGAKLGV
ncbi:hypothetical protein ACIQ6V_15480 [Streptomyces sp. NPDC096198]|uniref:hypothetical protein n=1 Tax=Streptomyces sp. NPDC096198 TaxID=3366080 RepID=UPI0037FFBD8B